MRILIVTATFKEIGPFLKKISDVDYSEQDYFRVEYLAHQMCFLVVGVGAVAMAAKLAFHLSSHRYGLVFNLGVAGAFPGNLSKGDVVIVQSEIFGDLGVENEDGSFSDIFETKLNKPDQPPFNNGRLVCNYPDLKEFELPLVKGLTVNKVHGSEYSIKHVAAKYNVDIESMEGAAFFYVCLLANIPFLQIRAISNIVERRNRDAWQIETAISNLAEAADLVLNKILDERSNVLPKKN